MSEAYELHLEQTAGSLMATYINTMKPQSPEEYGYCLAKMVSIGAMAMVGNIGSDAAVGVLTDMIEVIKSQPHIKAPDLEPEIIQ